MHLKGKENSQTSDLFYNPGAYGKCDFLRTLQTPTMWCSSLMKCLLYLTQDLVMGQTAQGDALPDPMMSLVNVLKPDSMSELDRFRLILIYIITQGRTLLVSQKKNTEKKQLK